MSFLSKINPFRRRSKRSYSEVTRVGQANADWAFTAVTEDADVWGNQYLLRARMRDLWKKNPYFGKYREELFANVFGSEGIMLRMKCTETESRIVYAADERATLLTHEARMNRVIDSVRRRTGDDIPAYTLFDKGKATVQVGQPDYYAIKVIEDAWKQWKRKENCDVRGQRNYVSLCNLRLVNTARDGGVFVRLVRDPKRTVNEFGFAIQLVPDEYCDYALNETLSNGNEIRMGIEYQWNDWGLGKPVAYYFIKRQRGDWQNANGGMFGSYTHTGGRFHDRVPASEILHYARYSDADSTRPAPWGVCNINSSRHLNKYEEAEVIAARVSACKMGWFYSDINPEGGTGQMQNYPDPTQKTMEATPGGMEGLEWGVKFQGFDPSHPNGNFDLFRKGMLRSWCAGLPGANYNIIANDLQGVNYSSGKFGIYDEREMWMLLQKFDIATGETPIFEAWLEMALVTGAVPLPLAKYRKFNKPHFRGRRWKGVEPVKEAQASALRIQNSLATRTREIEDSDSEEDFEEIIFKLAEEKQLMESLGLNFDTTEAHPPVQEKPEKESGDDEGDEDETEEKPKKSAQNITVNVTSGRKTMKVERDDDGRIIALKTDEEHDCSRDLQQLSR